MGERWMIFCAVEGILIGTAVFAMKRRAFGLNNDETSPELFATLAALVGAAGLGYILGGGGTPASTKNDTQVDETIDVSYDTGIAASPCVPFMYPDTTIEGELNFAESDAEKEWAHEWLQWGAGEGADRLLTVKEERERTQSNIAIVTKESNSDLAKKVREAHHHQR